MCGKVAKEKFSKEFPDKDGNTIKLITLECFHVIQKIIPRGTPYEDLVTNWWKPEVKDCKHEWTKTKCNNCGEFKLMGFQVEAARFVEAALAQGKGAGAFHEMGLGKTIIALAYLKFSKKRTLFIVKSAITFQWFNEILRVLGPEAFGQIIRTSRDPLIPNLRSYIVSYDLLRRFDRAKIQALGIEVVVLDECQQIKNPDSTRTQEVRQIVNDPNIKVIALSGTPWQNRGSEFFSVLNMMDPVKFYSYQHFLDTWVSYYWHGTKQKMGGIKNVDKFKQFTKDLIIRREYNEVMDEFPDVNRMKLSMQLDEMSQSNYNDAESAFVKWYNQHIIDGTEESVGSIEILAAMTRARHVVGLAKIPATLGYIEEFYEENDRSIVISCIIKTLAEYFTMN
jgi:SNF2 family DNA or RNA helicase